MSFDPDPTKQAIELLFSRKRSRGAHPPLFFNDQISASANDHKHLGIVLDCKLTFAKHIREIIAKARKGIFQRMFPYSPLIKCTKSLSDHT